ncbi:glycosyltransferase family 2 protein [Candidatus Bathyarchaeota archaeon]|nr:glycosyltransferase family 2 protein [Candidatus Bathyarchaeota archaeon]
MRREVADLGSYRNFDIAECLDRKLNSFIRDEADLRRPLLISLVIPTKIDVGRKTRELELDVLKRVLSECSKLIDLGYIDEILVIDGSLDQHGNADFSTLVKVVETAYEELDLFRRQVGLLRENRAEAIHSRRGFFDFIVKAVHQFDRNLFHVLEKYGASNRAGLRTIPPGKGAALWLALPMTKGDIVCFLDSDIMNFQKEFAVALCHPIVEVLRRRRRRLMMTKAYYKRLTMIYEYPHGSYTFGGRVTRLFAIPLMKVLTKEFPTIFRGFDRLKYPLSGEFAARRELLESIRFPSDYSIEFSILNQSMRRLSPSAIAQVDLDVFLHIGQTARGLDAMIFQITNRVLRTLETEGVRLSKERRKKVVSQYRKEALAMLPAYWRSFEVLQRQVDVDHRIHYSREIDMQRFRRFYGEFRAKFLHDPDAGQFLLPSWRELSSEINYFAVSSLLRTRSNQSTFSRLSKAGLLRVI